MVIDNQLRQRILRSLRWLVRQEQWRYNQVKENLDSGSQGYSPELKEAMHLLEDLEQRHLTFDTGQDYVVGWSEQYCKDAAVLLGYGEEFGREFFVYYKAQDWCWSHGIPLSGDLPTNMRRSKAKRPTQTPDAVKTKSGKTPLQKYYEDHKK